MSDAKSTTEHNGTSRRTVVRTAAHAAWAVPAIQIAAAAPAFASSVVTSDDTLVPGSLVATRLASDHKHMQFSFKVANDGPKTANITISFTATVSPKWDSVVAVPAGWTVSPTPLANNTSAVTLRYSGSIPRIAAAPHQAAVLGPTLSSQSNSLPIIGTPSISVTYS